MQESILFWSVYKNLEREVLEFSKYIHFSSDQRKVYSMSIADIIVRCAIEIEALSKKLYKSLGGSVNLTDSGGKPRDLFFDTDCLNLIEGNYLLSKKAITISTHACFFNEEDRILFPLLKANKRGSSGSKWKQAYQALKHDRYNSLKLATIENLMNTLGALYILNLYFRERTYEITDKFDSFDTRIDSEIFSVFTFDASSVSMSSGPMDDSSINLKPGDSLERAIYIVKLTDKHFTAIHEAMQKDYEEMQRRILSSPKVMQFFADHPGYQASNVLTLLTDAVGTDSLGQYVSAKHLQAELNRGKKEAVINRHKPIYPSLK